MKTLIILFILLKSLAFGIDINEDMSSFSHQDQFEKKHTITNDTKGIIFTFKKEPSHNISNFLSTKDKNYLHNKNILYVADVSAMPGFVKFFVLPSFKDYPFPIILLDDDDLSDKYKNEDKVEKIMFVILENKKVKNIKYFDGIEQLKKEI